MDRNIIDAIFLLSNFILHVNQQDRGNFYNPINACSYENSHLDVQTLFFKPLPVEFLAE